MFDKVLDVARDLFTTQERLKRLERAMDGLADEVDDVDARLIRVETIIEMGGGGRPAPRARRLPRPDR
jgi:hypothetical protein